MTKFFTMMFVLGFSINAWAQSDLKMDRRGNIELPLINAIVEGEEDQANDNAKASKDIEVTHVTFVRNQDYSYSHYSGSISIFGKQAQKFNCSVQDDDLGQCQVGNYYLEIEWISGTILPTNTAVGEIKLEFSLYADCDDAMPLATTIVTPENIHAADRSRTVPVYVDRLGKNDD
ncbi:MAG: hypothetical protein R3A45_10090 [Bdellovibrionota bacterium]